MKVLLTSAIDLDNPLISGYYNRLKKRVDITVSIDAFWNTEGPGNYDIIHLQWPEQLFRWKNVEQEDVERLEKQLRFWKQRGNRLVITRHNIFPHSLNALYKEIYQCVYANVDGVIHFSQASIDDFHSRYGNQLNNPGLLHEVIYHPMYEDVPNTCSREAARKALKIHNTKNVILVFGSIRHEEERVFIRSVFKQLEVKNRYLIAPRFYDRPSRRKLLQWLWFMSKRFLDRVIGSADLGYSFIDEAEIQLYMNAADVVFIPRFEVLNSGVAVLAYSFNRVVVGPSTGSIGELLEHSNNPSFAVGEVKEAALKLKEGLGLSQGKVYNLAFAKEYMSWELVVSKHLKLYEKVICK